MHVHVFVGTHFDNAILPWLHELRGVSHYPQTSVRLTPFDLMYEMWQTTIFSVAPRWTFKVLAKYMMDLSRSVI